MERIFDFRRFGRYLAYDLRNAKNNMGFTLLVYGVAPIFLFVIYEICSLIFSGYISPVGFTFRTVWLFALVLLCSIMAPSRLYGHVTDKRYGTEFLMIPASTFEKFLSLVIISAVVMPLCLAVLLLVSDSLLGLLFPNYYGSPLLSMETPSFFGIRNNTDMVYVNFILGFVVSWMVNMLVFTLGAIFFKKSKVAKTLLSYFAVSMVCGVLFSALIIRLSQSVPELFPSDLRFTDVQGLIDALNLFANIWYFFIVLVLLGLIFWRLKTLKH